MLVSPPLLYHPIGKGAGGCVEVAADLHDGQATLREAGGIVVQIDLLHGGCGGAVELQLEQIELAEGLHHHVHAPRGGAHLDVDVFAKQREYHEQELLVMPFIIRIIALGDCEEILLQEAEHAVEVAMAQGAVHLAHGYQTGIETALHV